MNRFAYQALSQLGETLNGEIDAISRDSAAAALIRSGLTPLHIAEQKQTRFAALNQSIGASGLSNLPQRLHVTRGLASLLQAGIMVPVALRVMSNSGRSREARAALADLHRDVRSGKSLAEALAGLNPPVPDYYTLMVRMGEKTGALDQALARILSYEEALFGVRSKLLSALLYPAIIVSVLTVTFMFIIGFVMPQFAPIFAGREDELPTITQIVFWFSQLVWGARLELMVGAGVFVIAGLVALGMPSFRQRAAERLMAVPLLGEYLRKRVSARYFRLLGTMVELGIPLPEACRIASASAGFYAAQVRFEAIADKIRAGERLSAALANEPLIAPLAHDLVPVGEQSGRLGAVLVQVSDMLDDEVSLQTDRFMTVFTPAVTVVLGGVTAVFVAAVVVGIMSVSAVVSS